MLQKSFSLDKKKIAILGSTGSIGQQSLQIIDQLHNEYQIVLLTAYSNQDLLAKQIQNFKPKCAVIDVNPDSRLVKVAKEANAQLIQGSSHIPNLIEECEPDIVVNAMVGFAGFASSVKTLELGLPLALANKESLVVGGPALTSLQKKKGGTIIPIDSEHSAMLQCLVGEDAATIRNIIITASGGPFRTWSIEQMRNATVKEALNHPNWDMGAKITIDSASMMNKGLEIIEAYWLFDLDIENIIPVIHPQSIIHSMVEFIDGSTKAQLGPPDMRVPISYALSYPKRSKYFTPVLDWQQKQHLTFEPVDEEKFPCLKLARQAVLSSGLETTVMNAANELAVGAFLNGDISFMAIPEWIEMALEKVHANYTLTLDHIHQVDLHTRQFMRDYFELK